MLLSKDVDMNDEYVMSKSRVMIPKNTLTFKKL